MLYRHDGEPLSENNLRDLLLRAAKQAGLRSTGPHMLRHTFCSHLAMRGAPARAIQELAGHKDLATTQRYMHLSPAAVESAIRLLDSPGVLPGRGDILETPPIEIGNVKGEKELSGEPGRNRTFNPQIKSLLLCQLSYWPTRGTNARGVRRRASCAPTQTLILAQPARARRRRAARRLATPSSVGYTRDSGSASRDSSSRFVVVNTRP